MTRQDGGKTVELGLRIDDEGRTALVKWNPGKSLAPLQEAVGGRVDIVSLTPHLDMWINDEGMFYEQVNGPATRLARLHGKTHQPFWGPVVIAGHDGMGETLGLHARTRAWLTGWLNGRCTAIFEEYSTAAACGIVQGHDGVHATVLDHRLRLWHGEPRSLDELSA